MQQAQVVQYPPQGPFSVDELDWAEILDHQKHNKVVSFPRDRLDDFVDGEAARGETAPVSQAPGKLRHIIDDAYAAQALCTAGMG